MKALLLPSRGESMSWWRDNKCTSNNERDRITCMRASKRITADTDAAQKLTENSLQYRA